ncbi:type III secretion-associated protein [Caballeronia pedi]|uniref:Type III secretion-associated protein n=1 Tax=Caballeronia pedi TaxID=1777141 RepID=A0A158AVA3_9BURK|nr:flagellar biosynthetic protein FliR [Caballeronia pedi]SAK61931.1 type III secretion-associated protein [Caballeronia pedi]
MNLVDQLAGFAFCTIRPAIAMSLIPFGIDGALGLALRVPLVLMFALLSGHEGYPSGVIAAGFVEAVIGLVMGLGLSVVFHVASAAGAVIDQQAGYSVAAVYDPNFQQESALFETLFTQFAALTFFTGDGLVRLCGVFIDGWALWAPGGSHPDLGRLTGMLAEARLAPVLAQGLQLAAPLLVLMLLVDMSVGLASRHAKRLNPFATARTVKVMALSVAAMLCVPDILKRLARIAAASLNLG